MNKFVVPSPRRAIFVRATNATMALQEGMASRKHRFPPEPDTRPENRPTKVPAAHPSGPAPKDHRARAEAPTMPPPTLPPSTKKVARRSSRPPEGERVSHVQKVERKGAATVDEVTADLSKDPRREKD
jgi:hypothetical protein